jgi:hypothetical protein
MANDKRSRSVRMIYLDSESAFSLDPAMSSSSTKKIMSIAKVKVRDRLRIIKTLVFSFLKFLKL